MSVADRRELEAVVANRNSPQKHVWRAKVVLLTADGTRHGQIMLATGKAKTSLALAGTFPAGRRRRALARQDAASGIPPLSTAIAERVVALTLGGSPAGSQPLDRFRDGERSGSASVRCSESGLPMASSRIGCGSSSCPTIRSSRPSCSTSSASISTRPTTPSFCRSMRRAKSRPWIAPNRACR
jgi:hypothetical protein